LRFLLLLERLTPAEKASKFFLFPFLVKLFLHQTPQNLAKKKKKRKKEEEKREALDA